jgi:integrase
VRGRQRNIKIGDASVVTLETARQRVAELQNQRALGRDPLEETRVAKQVPRLEAFVRERYLPYIQTYKRSASTDETLLRLHILPAFGDRHMDGITKYELTAFAQKKHQGGLAPGTVNRLVVLIRYIFNLALDWEAPGVTQNPARRIKLLPENNRRERYLSPDEVRTLAEAVRQSQNGDLEMIIAFLLMTGARKREALDAEWGDFEFEKRLWRIPKTKSGSARHVPLSDGLLHLLSQLPSRQKSPYLFPNPKTGKPYHSIYNSWDSARRRAGLGDVRLHDLRHSFASFLINGGRSLYEVQKLLGHHSISVTERYSHLSNDTLIDAANSASLYASQATPTSSPSEASAGKAVVPLIAAWSSAKSA